MTAAGMRAPWVTRRVALRRRRCAGFTLIELMAVIAVIAILAVISIPGIQDRLVREQIIEVVHWAAFVSTPVGEGWLRGTPLPADNAAAGLPLPDQVVSNYVKSLNVESGSLQIVFGNHAMSALTNKTISLRPAVSAAAASMPMPVTWVCARSTVPGGLVVYGTERTDIDARFLPLNCK